MLYLQRKVSIEPLFQTFKDIFGIRTVSVKGLYNVKSFVLICVPVSSVLQLYYWSRESKKNEENAMLLENDSKVEFDFIFVNHYAQISNKCL